MATILVVDDLPPDRDYVASLLRYRGHDVLEAADGAEALESARDRRPDLIISDILMPSIDGYELVRRVRDTEEIAQTPVIFYSAAYHEREARALALHCNVRDLLTKPSEPQRILAVVEDVLSRPRQAPAVPPLPPEVFHSKHLNLVSTTLATRVQELEASEQRLRAVVDFCQALAIARDPEALLGRLREIARRATLATQVAVSLEEGADAPLASDRPSVRHESMPDEGVSLLSVPIRTPSRVFGRLELRHKLGLVGFSDADAAVAVVLGAHAGIAYENARLLTDLRQRAEALRQSEARTEYALQAGHMAVWAADLVSGGVSWSPSMPAVFGVAVEDLPATEAGVMALVHPDDRPAVLEARARCLEEGLDTVVEFRVAGQEGFPQHWVAFHARLVRTADGTPSRLVGVAIDITREKALTERLRQSQKLEALGQLAGGVAHDFNNVLTAILGYSNFVLQTMGEDDARRADMQEVIASGERAAALTGQLLSFSRRAAGPDVVLDVNAVVGSLRRMLARILGEWVTLETALGPDITGILADRVKIEQVILNLVVNARDAMPHGGRIVLQTSDAVLAEPLVTNTGRIPPGRYVVLSVTDDGTGMDEAIAGRIFEPFFTTKGPEKGVGLGLATVAGVAERLHGGVLVRSAPSQGATFSVYLPAAQVALPAPPVEFEAAEPSGGTESVMLVEDEDAVRFLMRVILERAGYRVLDASNPQQAIEISAACPTGFDLLLTDVVMPGQSGPMLYRRLAAHQPGLKVLYVSGYPDDPAARGEQADAPLEFLQKPFSPDVLTRRVRQVLDGVS